MLEGVERQAAKEWPNRRADYYLLTERIRLSIRPRTPSVS